MELKTTTIVCSQQISTGEFSTTLDGEHREKRSKLIGLKYYDPRIFNHSTSVGNLTVQLAKLVSGPLGRVLDHYSIMHNGSSSHCF